MKVTFGSRGFGLRLLTALSVVLSLAITASAQEVEIVPIDARWDFLSPDGAAEDPGDADPNFDSTWFTPGYTPAKPPWEDETGPLEYGGIGGFNGLNPFPGLFEPASGDRYTNYFRHEFNTNRSYANVGAEILADDGAVIYLDGVEVSRFNCCSTPEDDYLSFSSGGGNEGSFSKIPLVDELAAGDHLLAVSVHQTNLTSSDLGLGLRLLSSNDFIPFPDDATIINTGVDTTLASGGLGGPDAPHGAEGQNPDGVERWEWDGSDGGGENQGLLWLDIPQNVLDAFGDGLARLRLNVDDGGDPGELYRMTVDWLAGPDGGDNVTWNNIPGGPGIVPGQNAERVSNVTFSGGETDVTEDVLAWASGEPNYGWGFLPTGGDGLGITSFESMIDPVPELALATAGQAAPALQAGDADMDLDFDQLDLVKVQIAGKYLTGQAATWGDGDWNGAPGGSPGSPPQGDGFFNQVDIIAALGANKYLQGKYAAISPGGTENDGQTSIVYNANTGEVAVDAPAGVELTSVNIESAASIFTGSPAENLGGSFDNDTDSNIFKATFGGSFGSISFGTVAQAGLSEEFVAGDLEVVGSLAGGGDLGAVDLIYIPEPSTVVMLALGLLALAIGFRRRR